MLSLRACSWKHLEAFCLHAASLGRVEVNSSPMKAEETRDDLATVAGPISTHLKGLADRRGCVCLGVRTVPCIEHCFVLCRSRMPDAFFMYRLTCNSNQCSELRRVSPSCWRVESREIHQVQNRSELGDAPLVTRKSPKPNKEAVYALFEQSSLSVYVAPLGHDLPLNVIVSALPSTMQPRAGSLRLRLVGGSVLTCRSVWVPA